MQHFISFRDLSFFQLVFLVLKTGRLTHNVLLVSQLLHSVWNTPAVFLDPKSSFSTASRYTRNNDMEALHLHFFPRFAATGVVSASIKGNTSKTWHHRSGTAFLASNACVDEVNFKLLLLYCNSYPELRQPCINVQFLFPPVVFSKPEVDQRLAL